MTGFLRAVLRSSRTQQQKVKEDSQGGELQVRPQQIDALAQAQLSRFSARVLLHIEKFFPEHFGSLGKERSLLLVRHGIERGKHYGITSERDVCKLIDLMLTLGPDMDRRFPWVAARLSDTAVPPSGRVDTVYDEILAALEKRANSV